jgi:hypothetical protein
MKIKMNSQRHSSAIVVLLLLVAAFSACNMGDESQKANKLVDEGNAAGKEAKTYVADAEAKKQKMLQTKVAQLEEAKATAKEAIAAYDKAEEKWKAASKKYEEASKLKIKDKFKEYLTLKVKEYNKRVELVEAMKGVPQALIDSKNRKSFNSSAKTTNQKVDTLTKEADDLAAQADKLQKDNPDILKS